MSKIVETMKSSKALILVGVLLVLLAGAAITNFSIMDFVADRVIIRMELDYHPYGPQLPASPTEMMVQPINEDANSSGAFR